MINFSQFTNAHYKHLQASYLFKNAIKKKQTIIFVPGNNYNATILTLQSKNSDEVSCDFWTNHMAFLGVQNSSQAKGKILKNLILTST